MSENSRKIRELSLIWVGCVALLLQINHQLPLRDKSLNIVTSFSSSSFFFLLVDVGALLLSTRATADTLSALMLLAAAVENDDGGGGTNRTFGVSVE